MNDSIALLTGTLIAFLNIYLVILLIRFALSWFPNINWFDPPFSILIQLTDPYVNLFRSIFPPIGGIDFISPMLAIILLQVAAGLLSSLQASLI